MKIIYGIIKETYCIEEQSRTSYGIAAYHYDDKEKTYDILTSVHDITNDKDKLSELIQNCNKLKLSLIHIYDVIEDFLVE